MAAAAKADAAKKASEKVSEDLKASMEEIRGLFAAMRTEMKEGQNSLKEEVKSLREKQDELLLHHSLPFNRCAPR